MSIGNIRTAGRTGKGWFIGAVLIAAPAAATGCGADAAPPTNPSHITVPDASTTSATPTSADARTGISTSYQRYWELSSAVWQRPESEWQPTLAQVTAEPQLTRLLQGYRYLQANRTTLYGSTTERISTIDVAGTQATVTDCQDASHSGQADAASGKPRNVGVPRNPVRADMVRGNDGQWRVLAISYPDGTC